MKTSSILLSGISHLNFNEDNQLLEKISDRFLLSCVMDGCSTAVDSSFASMLMVKLLRKSHKSLHFEGGESVKDVGEAIMKRLFENVIDAKDILDIDEIELMTTLIVGVSDIEKNELWINISGDGCFSVNGEYFEINQSNTPDFFAYHFDKRYSEWIDNHTLTFIYHNVHNFIVSTDGINKISTNDSSFSAVDFIMKSQDLEYTDLNSKFSYLAQELNAYPGDDISVISVCLVN